MKQQLSLIIVLVMLPVMMFAAAPVVSNVQVAQRTDGSMLVDITYDVADADGDDLEISVECSNDGGTTWDYAITQLSGDVGPAVAPGTNKAIVWDFPAEHPDDYDTDFVVRVTAEDGNAAGPAMILVPAGSFQMGRDGVATPIHTVNLDAFYIGKYEVTHQEVIDVYNWANQQGYVNCSSSTVTNATGNQQELLDIYSIYCAIDWNGSQLVFGGSPKASDIQCPCIEITWYGSVAYCNYLSLQQGLTPCYDLSDWSCDWSANGYRLPTEAEWEYSARGATNTPDYLYAGSDNIDEVAWYISNSSGHTHPVGQKDDNDIGTYDQSGNVYEWCWDWYDSSYYGSSPQDNPTGPSGGSYRVFRGGGWSYYASACEVAYRTYTTPSFSNYYLGFRLCRTAE